MKHKGSDQHIDLARIVVLHSVLVIGQDCSRNIPAVLAFVQNHLYFCGNKVRFVRRAVGDVCSNVRHCLGCALAA